jgi:hypothetical protein
MLKVALSGETNPLMLMLLDEALKRFSGKWQLYDRSNRGTRAATLEASLAPLLRAEDRAWAKRLGERLQKPHGCDVEVSFFKYPDNRVVVIDSNGPHSLVFPSSITYPQCLEAVETIIQLISKSA